jgi:hypothetical protein
MATGPVGHVIGTLKFGTPTMMTSHTVSLTESAVPDGKRSNLRHFLSHNSQIRAFIHCLGINTICLLPVPVISMGNDVISDVAQQL